jgi:hypothetical protein
MLDQLLIPDDIKSTMSNERLTTVCLLNFPWIHDKLRNESSLSVQLQVACGQQHSILYFVNVVTDKRIRYFKNQLFNVLQGQLFSDIILITQH